MNQDRSTTITNSQLKDGYKQTEVGVIPEDWEIKRLKHISPSQSVGLVINPSSYFDNAGTIPMLVGSHINENGIDWESANRISDFSNNLLPSSRLTAGDLVTVRVGDPGLTAVVPSELDGCNCASMMIVRQHRSFISRWLCYVMNSPFGRSQIEHVQYGTAQKQFNISDAIDFSYPVPPLPEQEAIASTLSDIDALIESLDRLLIKKRQIKQGAMQELLRSKDGWIVKRLGEICEIGMGRTPARLNGSFWGKGYKWLSIADLKSKVVNESKEEITSLAAAEMRIIPKGTLLMSFKLSLGRLCFAGCDLFTNEAICSFNQLQADANFLYYVLGRTDFSLYGKQAVKGYTLNKESLNLIEVNLPSLAEQIEIANILSDMDAEIESISAKLTKTRQLKQGMMHELLTGRIRLVDPTQ